MQVRRSITGQNVVWLLSYLGERVNALRAKTSRYLPTVLTFSTGRNRGRITQYLPLTQERFL
jgi:hypothetical protein